MTALFRFRASPKASSIARCEVFLLRGKSDKESLVELAERAERLKDEQRKRQQQLEQASDNKQPSEK